MEYTLKLFNFNGELIDEIGIIAVNKKEAYIKAREFWDYADENYYIEAEEDFDCIEFYKNLKEAKEDLNDDIL